MNSCYDYNNIYQHQYSSLCYLCVGSILEMIKVK